MEYIERLKQEEINNQIKKKKKKEKRKMEREKKFQEIKDFILTPPFKNNIIKWEMKGNDFYGYYEDNCFFCIKRGVLVFSLKILDNGLKEKLLKSNKFNISSSMDLVKVQKKANDILTWFISSP